MRGQSGPDNSPLELIAPQQDLQQTTETNTTNTTRLIIAHSQPQLARLPQTRELQISGARERERERDIYRL